MKNIIAQILFIIVPLVFTLTNFDILLSTYSNSAFIGLLEWSKLVLEILVGFLCFSLVVVFLTNKDIK